MHPRTLLPAVFICAVSGLASFGADAATVIRSKLLSPVNQCQGALPSYEGAFRKRPIAIKNEGVSSAFITCATFGNNGGPAIFSLVAPYFRNANASGSVTINCTLSDGFLDSGAPTLLPKSITLTAGAGGYIQWDATDNGGLKFRSANTSCSIPAGVEVGWFGVFYDEEIPD